MVSRNKQIIRDTLYSEALNCYPPENQAAKIFAKWLTEHPEFTVNDVDMYIDSHKREEDYYGNGGGYDRYVRIFKCREETDDEYNARIAEEEAEAMNTFRGVLKGAIHKLINDFNIYHCMVSDEITDHVNRIETDVMSTVENDIRK